jgi:hypothetical protein
MRNAYRMLVGNPERKKSHGRHRRRRSDVEMLNWMREE